MKVKTITIDRLKSLEESISFVSNYKQDVSVDVLDKNKNKLENKTLLLERLRLLNKERDEIIKKILE